jgi:hypothetical protein
VSLRVSLRWQNRKSEADWRKRWQSGSMPNSLNLKQLATGRRKRKADEKLFQRLPASQPLKFVDFLRISRLSREAISLSQRGAFTDLSRSIRRVLEFAV